MDLTTRQQQILLAIVEEYIATGQPVGSKHLCKVLNIQVSSATIRKDMAVLYDFGYLEQPHTSAGRVPSHLGYREYVDHLMDANALSKEQKNYIDSLFNVRSSDPECLLADAAKALSDYTGYAAVTSSLVSDIVRIRRLDFIAAGKQTLVIVLSASNGIVRSKICRVGFLLTDRVLNFIYQFANAQFVDQSISAVTASYVRSISVALGDHLRTLGGVILSIYELCQEMSQGRYYVSGSTKLLSYTDELGRLAQDLLNMVENTENLEKLFGKNILNFRLLIGKENSAVELTDSAVMVTQYCVCEQPAGTVGLIAPTRLDYRSMIPHLNYFAQTLGELMNDTLEADARQMQL